MKSKALFTVLIIACIFLPATVSAQSIAESKAVENVLLDAVQNLEDGKLSDAESRLKAILKSYPQNDAAHYYMGMAKLSSGSFEEAEKSLKQAASLDSTNTWYKDALAELYSRTHREGEAVALYKELMVQSPQRYRTSYVLTMMGDEAMMTRQDSLAMSNYEQALLLDPSYSPALLGVAELYRMKGNYPAFFTNLNGFVGDPNVYPQAKTHYLDALFKHVDGRFYSVWHAQLDSLASTCERLHPTDSSVLNFAGSWYYGTGRKEKALELFARWLELYPESILAHEVHMQLCYRDKNYAGVFDELEKLVVLSKDEPAKQVSYISDMGDVYHSLGDAANAYKSYDRALKIDPDYLPVLNNYAYYLSMEGKRLRKAEAMSRKTIEKEPDNPTYLDTYGWILYLRGKAEEAKPYFKHAMIYGGKESAVVLEHYSKVLEKLGEKDLASYYKGLSESKAGK